MATTIITNVQVFDGHALKGPSSVTIKDGLIASIEDAEHAQDNYPADANIIDGTNCTLLPGLIDCHVHADTLKSLSSFPPAGITTVLDMGAVPVADTLRTASVSPASHLPTYRSSVVFAAARGSRHAKLFGLDPDSLVTNPEQAAAFVQDAVARGADHIKVITDVPGFDEPTLAAFVQAAKEAGKLSVAHAATVAAYERAARAGFDVVTHVPMDGPVSEESVRLLKTKGAVVVPTVGMMRKLTLGLKGMTVLENLAVLHRAGIPICAGTDANELPVMGHALGKSLHKELRLMVQAGMGTAEVLASATAVAAERFRFEDRGTMEVGKRADLVLVDGDPVEDVANTAKVVRVWIGGVQAFPGPGKGGCQLQ